MGTDRVNNCSKWLNDLYFPFELNLTNIVLIPKCYNPTSMKDLQPIALCNVVYRIMAKVLANRSKVILRIIISYAQSAFIPGICLIGELTEALMEPKFH